MRLSVAADWPCLFHPGLIAFHRKRQTNDKHSDLIVNWRRREAEGKKRVKEDLRNYCRVGGRRAGEAEGRREREGGAWKKREEEENRRRSGDDCSLLSVIGFAWPRAQLFTGYCWHFNSYDSNRSRPIVQ